MTKDKQRIIERYNQRLEKYGPSFEVLASGTEERRLIHYEVLSEVGDLNGKSVLDLGCGFGDFLGFLQDKGVNVDYTGYDINPNLIKYAKEKYPKGKFFVVDILKEDFPIFDYIISNEAFNLTLMDVDNYDYIKEILEICYSHSRIGVAIELLSSYVDFESKEGFHYLPEKVFSISKGITKKVCLRHDYPLFDFIIYLYKDFKGWAI